MNRPFTPLKWTLCTCCAALGLCLASPLTWADAPEANREVARPAAMRYALRSSMEVRVELLSKALDLDLDQQVLLRKLLEEQREQVSKVWRNTALPGAYRVRAIQAASEQTANRIRDILNDAQKNKYDPPRLLSATDPAARADVSAWMTATSKVK